MKTVRRTLKGIGVALAVLGLIAFPASADQPDLLLMKHPNALWDVVHGLCLRDKRLIGRPAPCLAVDRAHGYAVVPDPRHRTQVLLVPTTRMEGIESPELLEEGAVNYWQAAWDARTYFEKRARRPVPRDDIAMAINSKASRSQRQLHIHIDCVRPDVRAVLKAREGEIGAAWATLRPFPGGAVVKARRLDGAALAPRNPFALLADGDAEARADMGRFTLVVVGAVFADGTPGFILLETGVPPAFGEGLLDHACAVLREP